jgi:hypothetical protein
MLYDCGWTSSEVSAELQRRLMSFISWKQKPTEIDIFSGLKTEDS